MHDYMNLYFQVGKPDLYDKLQIFQIHQWWWIWVRLIINIYIIILLIYKTVYIIILLIYKAVYITVLLKSKVIFHGYSTL